jgi:tetratricopeptide (TPR) repeat protein/2-polyprenyl-3-methyl-5-hydroxy-6-metoxy-1,4-benzoquinol methylase/predicted O-methyltransferase YrrM
MIEPTRKLQGAATNEAFRNVAISSAVDRQTQQDRAGFDEFAHRLRDKWREVPATRQGRMFSSDMLDWADERLLTFWEECRQQIYHPEMRCWQYYEDDFAKAEIADVGPGLGFDGVYLAERGAHIMFVDVVEDNLKLLRRICQLKGIDADYYYIDNFFEFHFKRRFDLIVAMGSLHHTPFEYMKDQVSAMMRFLKVNGRVVMLTYPRERFIASGAKDFAEFGRITDGERTPWAEWYDDEKVKRLFGPDFRLNWSKNFGKKDIDFNWFDLTKIAEHGRTAHTCGPDFDEPAYEPYLSIVVTSRNDDHGGNLLVRMQAFVDGIFAQSAKFGLPVELILVEWNPPADRKPLAEVLSLPASHDYCAIRIIQVPPAVHQRYAHAAALPLYQMIAKNVGIRRARGEFVLATNVDILLSDELFAFIASRQLQRGALYRVDRYDVQKDFSGQATHESRLASCKANTFRINKRNGTINLLNDDYHMIYPDQGRLARERLHTNGSGDFQLMHRDHWFALHGYPEFDMYSFHLDSLMCYMAHFGGAQEHSLDPPMCIYHIEHEAGWTPESDKENGLWKHLQKSNIPRMTNDQRHAWADRMTAEHRTIIFNDGTWGHAVETFKECLPIDDAGLQGKKPGEMKSDDKKYLSIVVTSRNDDHGGNTLHRMQVFTKAIIHQCRKFKLDAELVFVEWNPPADKPRLHDVLDLPDDLGPLTVRFIEVPPEVHSGIGNSDKFPLFQMIAKNVGIRRTRGRFVLATNIDILFSNELMEFLASRQLEEDCFYRIDRHDVGACRIPEDLDVEAQLDFCRGHLIRIQGLYGTKPVSEIGSDHFTYTTADTKLHENACGDFTLMSREAWHRLRAYPELPLWSIYVDGLLLHMAFVGGLRQVVLKEPLRIYHIEHATGWAVIPQTMQERPSLDHNRDYMPWCRRMLEKGRPITNNNADWGYTQMEFAETRLDGQWIQRRKDSPPSDPASMFQEWIDAFAVASNRLYYRDQTAKSLKRLYDLAREFRPTRIVELGTLSGMSLRTWLEADKDAEIIAVNLSFKSLHESRRILPVDLSRVTLIEQDILKTDFSRLWSAHDKVLFYVDAHDLPNAPIMQHLLDHAAPSLPVGSIVVIDDLWHSPEPVSPESISRLADKVIIEKVDPLQCFEGWVAPYWKGGFWIGFREVVPLMAWVNRNRIELLFDPEDKTACFVHTGTSRADPTFNEADFRKYCRTFSYNPVAHVTVLEQNDSDAARRAQESCARGAELFAARQTAAALNCFEQALRLTPNIRGALYAQAVCHAVLGDLNAARIALDLIPDAFSDRRRRMLREGIRDHLAATERIRRNAAPRPSDQTMTIFSIPKPFRGHIGVIQRNAIKSWTMLEPRPEIILLGDDEGTADMARQFGLKHIPHIECNEAGTPLLDSIFQNGALASAAPVLAYVNADIVLLDDFIMAVEQVRQAGHESFLMVGQRWDLDIDRELAFETGDWASQLRADVRRRGKLQAPDGIDYFVYMRDLWRHIPPFALGRTVWDNWLVAEAIRLDAVVIDATPCVTAIHQDHDYGHIAGGKEQAWKGAEAKRNLELAGGYGNIRSVSYAPHILTSEGIIARVLILNQQGEAAFHRGEYETATQYFNHALAIEPSNLTAINNLGVLHWQKQDMAKALTYFKFALNVQPDSRQTIRNLVHFYANLHHEKEAARLLLVYLQKHPDDGEMRTELESLDVQVLEEFAQKR